MPGLVETFAQSVNWKVLPVNVIVEGTSDVSLMWLAAALYFERYKTPILGDKLAILAAGVGDDGGVEGVNRRINFCRQLAEVDRGSDGRRQYRFIALYDNDRAGRRAVEAACNFDRRLVRYLDLFLLHPIMPLAEGKGHSELRRRFETLNSPYRGLDWEIEDLISERLLRAFSNANPSDLIGVEPRGSFKHWEFKREGKAKLHKFVQTNAKLEDVLEVVRLIRALHDYNLLPIQHFQC